ncbi:MAG: SHOCT domain-containing protein [Candidatus Saccharibacteria bacterium]
MYYNRMMDGNDWVGGLMMMLLGLLFIAIVVVVAIKLLKSNQPTAYQKSTALDIAKERYAKGELDREAYEKIKKDLSD